MINKIKIDSKYNNCRIDKVIKILFPEFGLRACRRMICSKHILLNQMQITPGKRVKTGDIIDIDMEDSCDNQLTELPYLLGENEFFYFVYKPRNLHSVTLSGQYNKSLENFLVSLCHGDINNEIAMLQRLDYGTSGLITIAKNRSALKMFRQAEKENNCRKFYIALLDGKLETPITVQQALGVQNKKKTIVLDMREEDSGRWTKFFPLLNFDKKQTIEILTTTNKKLDLKDGQELTLAGCEIMRGARHQIRAHAASLGHPLLGDGLYGKNGDAFFLHHGAIITPYFRIFVQPTWHLASNFGMIISDWLENQIK